MRHLIIAAAATFLAGSALAQTASPPANPNPGTPAVAVPGRGSQVIEEYLYFDDWRTQ